MRLRASCAIREQPHYRRSAFCKGLEAVGYKVGPISNPQPEDLLVIWNRYGQFDQEAKRFEAVGARVVVVENGYLGTNWQGDIWYSMALGHHAGAGTWILGDDLRWDGWGVELKPWRIGTETVILGQRGIGEEGVRSPDNWAEKTKNVIGGRIRAHPGNKAPLKPLADDLADASSVATWASSAALSALIMGVPVWYGMPLWIGAEASKPLAEFGTEPNTSDEARLSMFRRLAWAMWRLGELESGEAFKRLLG